MDDLEKSRAYLHEWQRQAFIAMGMYPMMADARTEAWNEKLAEMRATDHLTASLRDFNRWRMEAAGRYKTEPILSAILSQEERAELERVASGQGLDSWEGLGSPPELSGEFEVPTRFEHPGYYRIMMAVDRIVRKSIHEFDVEVPDPVLGTLPHAEPHAMLASVPDSNRPLVLFHTGLFAFLETALTLLAAYIGHGERTVQEAARREVERNDLFTSAINEEPGTQVKLVVAGYFIDLLSAFLVMGDPDRAKRWTPYAGGAQMHVTHTAILPTMQFVLLHEYAHLALGHLDDTGDSPVIDVPEETEPFDDGFSAAYRNEFAADGAALAILFDYSRRYYNIVYGMNGAISFFWLMILVERARAILIGGSDEPEPGSALEMLYQRLSHLLIREVRVSTEQENAGATLMAVGMMAAVEQLWERVGPAFTLLHQKGIRPYPSWKHASDFYDVR